MAKLLDEIHPGEILLEDFMKPMGISARQPAADIDVSPSRISELVNGQRPITADTALRLGRFFGTSERFWLNLQNRYDLEPVFVDASGESRHGGLALREPSFVGFDVSLLAQQAFVNFLQLEEGLELSGHLQSLSKSLGPPGLEPGTRGL